MQLLLAAASAALAAAGALAACPPACPETDFVDALRHEARAAGIEVAAPDPDLLAHHRERPADDEHFYKSVAQRQLERWRDSGIGRSDVDAALSVTRATKYQLDTARGRLFRSESCMFSMRCKGVEHFLARALPALKRRNRAGQKDIVEFSVNVRDWPQAIDGIAGTPVLSFSKKTDREADIMYPAWAFWEGGPWLATIPTWQWPTMRRELTAAAAAEPFAKKTPAVFFRGSRTSSARDPFVHMGHARRGEPPPPGAKRWNIRYIKNQSQRSNEIVEKEMGLDFAEPTTMAEHCKYRYLLNFDGQAASFRYKTLFLCGSLVLSVDLKWQEFWYGMLIPWVHYVPLAADGSDADRIVDFLEAHPDEAATIAENGRQFVLQRLRMEDVQHYWDDLLTEYATLQSFTVSAIDSSLIEIPVPKQLAAGKGEL
jgi:protein glucosyltransferase